MSFSPFAVRSRRFVPALLLVLAGATTHPGAAPTQIAKSADQTKSPDRQIARSQDLPPGLFLAIAETRQRDAGAAYDAVSVADARGTYRAANRAHGFDATFDAGGVRVSPNSGVEGVLFRLAAETSNAWRLEQGRVVRQHKTADGRSVDEWYVNGPLGLEQGFTITRDLGFGLRDSGDDTIRLSIGVGSATVQPSGGGAILTDASGKVRLSYGAIDAWDATGRRLSARIETSATALGLVVDAAGAEYPITIDPIVQQAQLVASDGVAFDAFGWSVAIDGDTALVGVPFDDVVVGGVTRGNQGSVYVFTRSGGIWTQQAQLVANDGAVSDLFGISVALDGDTALVGANRDNVLVGGVTNNDQGSAYVFTRSGTSWTQQAQLVAGDGAAGDEFGISVALDGHTALVGAYQNSIVAGGVTVPLQGSAYVFTRSGATWTQQAQLLASDGADFDQLGYSVALDNDTALVSAIVGGSTDRGSAYVFTRTGTAWTQQTQFEANNPESNGFGWSVALDGDTALVGSIGDNVIVGGDVHFEQGSAYVFTRSGATWTQQAQLVASDGAQSDAFGWSVALEGDTALVGAALDSVAGGVSTFLQGSAYVFTRSGTTWTQHAQLVAGGGGADDDRLGSSVALSGGTALAGAPTGFNFGNPGSAYVFTGLPAAFPVVVSAAPPNIFPADRRYARVTLTASIGGTPLLNCGINSISLNTPQQGVQGDSVVISPMVIDLRAERPVGGVNRKYTLSVACPGVGTGQIVVEVTGVR